MTDEDRINRGLQAAQELRVTGEAFDGVRDHIIAALCATHSSDHLAVLTLHRQLEALALVRKALILTVSDGDVARAYAEASQGPAH